ncbi:MAG: hypothetical protein RSC26_13535 [Terrisporobacter sp.]
MENKERATEQLSGRVTESQKEYFSNIEGSFTEKVAELIELHRNKVDSDVFTISPNLDAIQKAINTITKNIECIEVNTNTYVEDFNNTISSKISILETDSIELRDTKELNIELEKANQIVIDENSKLQIELENIKNTVENKEIKINNLVEENNKLLQYKLNTQEEIQNIKLEHKIQLEQLQKEIADRDININNLDTKILLEESKSNTLKEKIEEYKTTIADNKKIAKEETQILNTKIDSLIQEVQQSNLDKQKLEIELTNKLNNKQLELDTSNKLIDSLKEEIESLRSQINKPKSTTRTKKD